MAVTTENRTVTTIEARIAIEACFRAKRPVFVWGPPGIGKSDLIGQIGANWTDEKGKVTPRNIVDVRLSLWDPTDIKGIPYFDSGDQSMKWAPPQEFVTFLTEDSILFLDELNSAAPAVQAAAYQLVLNRRVGAYELPQGVSVAAAGNRETDKGVTYRMPSPLTNRFIHLELRSDFPAWQDWAIEAKVHPDVIGFLNHFKNALFEFNPKTSGKAFATPRSWTFVSDLIQDKRTPEYILTDLIAGTVGEGLAVKFKGHRDFTGKLPLPEDVLAGKVTEMDPALKNEVSAQYALTTGMCYELKEAYDKLGPKGTNDWHAMADNFFRFMMDNFGTEVAVMGAKVAIVQYKLKMMPTKLKHFDEFHKRFGKLVITAVDG